MKKFEFRLQRVLEYKELVVKWAKDAYLDTRVKRLECEAEVMALVHRRNEILFERAVTIEEHQHIHVRLQTLDMRETEKRIMLQAIEADEQACLDVWHEKQQEFESIAKLREKDVASYQVQLTRAEQAELDEWTSQRRAA